VVALRPIEISVRLNNKSRIAQLIINILIEESILRRISNFSALIEKIIILPPRSDIVAKKIFIPILVCGFSFLTH
jgi:hypothetical protein